MSINEFSKYLNERYDYIGKLDAIKLGCSMGLSPINAKISWTKIDKFQNY